MFFIVICKHLFSYGSGFIYLASMSPPPPISKRRATSTRCRTGLVILLVQRQVTKNLVCPLDMHLAVINWGGLCAPKKNATSVDHLCLIHLRCILYRECAKNEPTSVVPPRNPIYLESSVFFCTDEFVHLSLCRFIIFHGRAIQQSIANSLKLFRTIWV